jgi:hypothetical protein
MSMGLKRVEATPSTGNYNNDEARMHMGSDPCRYVLYNTGALTLVPTVIARHSDVRSTNLCARRYSSL